VIAVMSDLFFAAQIQDIAKRLGLTSVLVKDRETALTKIQPGTVAIVLDLNCAAADPLHLIQDVRHSPVASGVFIIGFVSHVQADLRQRAADSGCDRVVTRSVFTRDLPALLETAIKSSNARFGTVPD
jgi:CheY-like chemotaxis protein